MTDDTPNDSWLGDEPLEEWVGSIAEAEGLSREEVGERLVSSYWKLKEIFQLIERTEEGERDGIPVGSGSSYPEALSDELAGIRERLSRVEDEALDAEDGPTTGELQAAVEELSERVTSVERTVTARQESIESRIDEELGDVSTVLDYLIETTDDLDGRIETLIEDEETDHQRRVERDRLAELRETASHLDVRRGRCEYCDTSVDIALLSTPRCPRCDRRFADIEPSTGWFGFGSNVLEVAEEPYPDGAPADDQGPDGPVEDGDAGDDFVWGDRDG